MLNSDFAFVFPGQGSQYVGMLADFADSALVRDHFAVASSVLGYDLWQLMQQGPDTLLNQTDKTQPAMLTASLALYRIWQKSSGAASDVVPKLLAGHSLGEYSALVAAGVLDFKQAVSLVKLRGSLMQQAVPEGEGAMAAIIGLQDKDVEDICDSVNQTADQAREFVSVANYNSPGQVVVAGYLTSVNKVIAAADKHNARMVIKLPVSVPAHTELMATMTDAFTDALNQVEFSEPQVGVLQNASVRVEYDPVTIRGNLISQLTRPVRWTQAVGLLLENGINQIIECGPGKVLTGLNKRIVKTLGVKDMSCIAFNSVNIIDTYKFN